MLRFLRFVIVLLSFDGLLCLWGMLAGAGSLIRDSNGKWISSFQAFLGRCSNVVEELVALRSGLMLTWDCGFRCVLCEVDAMTVLLLLKFDDTEFHPCFGLL